MDPLHADGRSIQRSLEEETLSPEAALAPLTRAAHEAPTLALRIDACRVLGALSGRAFAIRREHLPLLVDPGLRHRDDDFSDEPLQPPFRARRFMTAARQAGLLNLVWSHQTFTITGTALGDTRWFNPQLYRLGGTLTTSKGFDESFRVEGGPLW